MTVEYKVIGPSGNIVENGSLGFGLPLRGKAFKGTDENGHVVVHSVIGHGPGCGGELTTTTSLSTASKSVDVIKIKPKRELRYEYHANGAIYKIRLRGK